MAQVFAHMTMSLDGFIAGPNDEVDHLFDWYSAGEVATPSKNPDIVVTLQTDAASAALLRGFQDGTGALVCGRRLFDLTQGWGGQHPIGPPIVIVMHEAPTEITPADAPFTFVITGVTDAIAQAKAIAGHRDVIVTSPTITQQCLDLGLLDEIVVSLAPVLLGEGIPWFAHLTATPVTLDDPRVIEGNRATHLRYRVRRPQDAAD